jgi:biotin carboxyl carrier protein
VAIRPSLSRLPLAALGLALLAGPVAAHEGHTHDEAVAVPQARVSPGKVPSLRGVRMADGTVVLPKPAQYRLGIKSRVVRDMAEANDLPLAAEAIPDPSFSARIASTERGLLSPPPGGFPRIGQRVAKGAVLAYVEPLIEEADLIRRRADLAKTEQELVINEQGLKQLGMQIKNQAQMATTTIYQGNMMQDRESLKIRQRTTRQSLTGKLPLIAPVAGEVSIARAQTGALVEGGELVFEVLDPSRLWIEARSFDRIDHDDIDAARAVTRDGTPVALRYMGQGLAANEQAYPLEFEAGEGRDALRVGERLTVSVRLKRDTAGLVLPKSSVGRDADGGFRVWMQTGAERFKPRQIKIEPLPGERVLVADGLAGGERIVVEGGWLLDQIR